MNAVQVNPPVKFNPVVLTLETQEEVDKLFAIFNNARISGILKLHNAYNHLKPFVKDSRDSRDSSWGKYHTKLCCLMK